MEFVLTCRLLYGTLFYIMPWKIQPLRTLEGRCILHGNTSNLPIIRSIDCFGCCIFYGMSLYKIVMQHFLVVYHGYPIATRMFDKRTRLKARLYTEQLQSDLWDIPYMPLESVAQSACK